MTLPTKPTVFAARNPMALLNLPTEIRQQILVEILTNGDFRNTIELKAYKGLPESAPIPRYEARWQQKPIPIHRPTNPRVMLGIRTRTSTTLSASPLADFACRWNVPAPLFVLDYEYIDKIWKKRQAEVGLDMVDAWNQIFGAQFHINWVEDFKPHIEKDIMIVGSREVSPLGTNTYIQGGGKRLRKECPPGILSRDPARKLGTAVRRRENSIPDYSWKVHVKGFIKVDGEI